MKKIRVFAGVVLAVGLLAGCSAEPGAAMVVNGVTVSEKEVDQLAADLREYGAQRTDALNIAQWATLAKPLLDSNENLKIQGMKEQSLVYCSQAVGLEVTTDSPQLLQTYCDIVTLDALDPDFTGQLNDVAANAVVERNPRYGAVTSQNMLPDYVTTTDRLAAKAAQ